jgi:cobaltochelatase CobN
MGCCCGHPERGGPKTVPGTLKRQMRRAFREARLPGLRLAFTDCLGPCSEANVAFLYLRGVSLWLRRMSGRAQFVDLFAYARGVVKEPGPLPPGLAERSFTWAGGGTGPEPPVADG